MDCFESAIWNKFGEKSIAASDRRKNLDWDPSKTRLYHCNIEKRSDSIVTLFKGPYLENTRTHLQKVVGDDSVLIVKFADIDITGNMQTTLVSTVHFTARLLKMEFFWVCDDIAFSFIKMEGRRRSKKKKRRKSKTKNSLLLSCAILFALSLGGTRMSLTSSPATRLIRPAGSLCTYILLLLWRNICPGFL
uniref:RDR3 n=1 Tax=Arundo donax TaxID=35708 RepID=A0A0A9CK16_ARUDO